MKDAKEACLVRAYNSSRRFLGLGLFSLEDPARLAFLSDKDGEITAVLAKALAQARALRKENFASEQTYRLVNSAADGFPGMTIDRLGAYFSISTVSSGADLLINPVAQILARDFGAKGILLKNQTALRIRKGLPLSEGALQGEIPKSLPILENGFSYCYDTGSQFSFTIRQRPLRYWLNNFLRTRTKSTPVTAGFIGCRSENLVSSEAAIHLAARDAINPDQTLSFVDICQKLRLLKEHPPWDIAVLHQGSFTPSPKNLTALFHLCYHLLGKLSPDGLLLLACHNQDTLRNVLVQAGKKSQKGLLQLESINQQSDFPEFLQPRSEAMTLIKVQIALSKDNYFK